MKKTLLFLALTFILKAQVIAQCSGIRNWPTGTFQAPGSIALPTQISLSFGNPSNQSGDYFKVVSFLPGRTYRVFESGGGFFTLTQSTANGPVAFYGSNVTFTITGSNAVDYYFHFYYDNTCTPDLGNYGVEVRLVSIGGTAPTLTTTQPVILSSNSATCGGNITSAGSTAVFARGVCWSNSPNPTVNNSSQSSGSGSGVFSLTVSSFAPNVTYHMRAWATNNTGTSYGNDVVFTPSAGCLGSTQYPIALQTGPTVNGQTVTVTQPTGNCNYSGDYFNITLIAGNFTLNSTNSTDFFTLSDQSNNVQLYQVQPLAFTVNTSGTYRVHINYSANCLTDNTCRGVSITKTGGTSSAPTVTTDAATAISSTGATSGGNVTSAGSGTVTSRGVCYSTSANPTISDSKVQSGSGTGAFTVNLTALTSGVTYHTRAFATSAVGTSYGSDVTFTTTTTSLPSVTTSAVTYISATIADAGGNVLSAGSDPITAAGVCYSTSPNPTIADLTIIAAFGVGPFSAFINGLVPGTTYHVRAYATTVVGTAYGADVTYTAPALATPTLTSTAVSAITNSSATSGGNITNSGGSSVTSRGVCYATTANPTLANNIVSGGSGTGSFTSYLSGLLPSTLYYVRAYATNSVGTAYGNQISFTTSSPNALQEVSAKKEIQVYPSPFATDFTIKVTPELFRASYSLVNASGIIVMNGFLDGESTILKVENLPCGIYYLKILGEKGIKISKY